MNQYRRIVSYVYRYENGRKGENTGFVRIDTREDGIRFHCRMKDLRMMDERRLKVYFYFHKENRLQLLFVDEILCVRGNCEYKKVIFPDLSDSDFDKINGIVFLDGQDLTYGSCWDEREISDRLLSWEEKEEVLETAETEIVWEGEKGTADIEEVMPENSEKISAQSGQMDHSQMSYSKPDKSILEQFPFIELPESENTIYAVQIQIEHLPLLPSNEWKMADNVFLKQAYENYEYLFLGKIIMPNDKIVWVLGVPGIYSNREKYLAGIFGFHHYIPEETGEFKTGGRGYWIRQIADVE